MRRLSVILAVLILASCQLTGRRGSNIVRIKGSDTMLILVNQWAEAYMMSHPGTSIYVEGGGSTSGLDAIIKNEVDIAMASRLIRTDEARKMAERYSSIGISYLVAKDALSIYLNPDNPVESLTIGQLKAIFSGEIRNWNEVGGKDKPVMLAIRPPTSGTYLYFKRFVMEELPFHEDHHTFSTTRSLIAFIEEMPDAIAFGGIGYGEDIKHCSVEGVAPTEVNVKNDSYPLARYLYFYTVDRPSRDVRLFIDWVMKDEGQRIVRLAGYIPIWLNDQTFR